MKLKFEIVNTLNYIRTSIKKFSFILFDGFSCNTDLHLTVITPLVRTNVNGIRVKDGLAMRKPLFDDEIMEDEWEEVLKKLDKFFTGKEGKSEMDRICLQFDFHRFDLQGNEELKPMCEPIISNTIINSKSRYFKLFSTVFICKVVSQNCLGKKISVLGISFRLA